MTRTLCSNCHKGTYIEKFSNDDMDGILHCSKCNHGINRWSTEGDTDMTLIDEIMLTLAEKGETYYFPYSHSCTLDDIRGAAREDGVQIRVKLFADRYSPSYRITLRKVGLGH